MPTLPDILSSAAVDFDQRPHRSPAEIKAEVEGALLKFVEKFNHDNEAGLTVEELIEIERTHNVHHVLSVMELYGVDFRAHLDDPPGASLISYQGGWMAQWESEQK